MSPFRSERRTYERSKLRGPVELSWTGKNGEPLSAVGNCVNVSIFGISVEFPCAVPVSVLVNVQSGTEAIPETARVCHCRRYGPWFRVGLRFEEPVVQKELLVGTSSSGSLE